MIKYYYDANGDITEKVRGNIELVSDNDYIETTLDIDITQYTVSGGALVHTPTEKTTNPRG